MANGRFVSWSHGSAHRCVLAPATACQRMAMLIDPTSTPSNRGAAARKNGATGGTAWGPPV
jgi:hypothetical protein